MHHRALSALATEAQGADEGANGANSGNDGRGGDGRPSGDDSNSRFICINNNDNTVVEGEEPDLACEECFAANSNLQTAIEDFLVDFDGITIDAGPFGIFVLGPGTDTIEQLCDMIESSAPLYGIPLSDALLKLFLSDILNVDPKAPNTEIDTLIECLLEAGIIVDRELPPPPPDSISNNPITTQSNNPITTQSNNPITTQSNNPITTQSNNPITTTTTTQSSKRTSIK